MIPEFFGVCFFFINMSPWGKLSLAHLLFWNMWYRLTSVRTCSLDSFLTWESFFSLHSVSSFLYFHFSFHSCDPKWAHDSADWRNSWSCTVLQSSGSLLPDQADWLYLLVNMHVRPAAIWSVQILQHMIDVQLIPTDYLTSQLQEAKW